MVLLAGILPGISLLAGPLADDGVSSNSASNAPSFKAEVRYEGGPGFSPAYRAYLTVGTNRFAFLIPSGFRLRVSEQRRVQLIKADYSCLLTVQFLEGLPLGAKELNIESGRETVLQRYPGARILDQSAPKVCGCAGLSYDLEWIAPGKLVQRTRVILVGTNAGIMELSLTSSPEQFGAAQRGFNTLLLTLVASDSSGKLTVAPISSLL